MNGGVQKSGQSSTGMFRAGNRPVTLPSRSQPPVASDNIQYEETVIATSEVSKPSTPESHPPSCKRTRVSPEGVSVEEILTVIKDIVLNGNIFEWVRKLNDINVHVAFIYIKDLFSDKWAPIEKRYKLYKIQRPLTLDDDSHKRVTDMVKMIEKLEDLMDPTAPSGSTMALTAVKTICRACGNVEPDWVRKYLERFPKAGMEDENKADLLCQTIMSIIFK